MKNLINKLMGRYAYHPEAVIISCFFNPQGSEYRLKAFKTFYKSIQHLEYRIIECVIGDSKPQLTENDPNIQRIYTEDLLWHKESILNKIISELPPKYKYVYWVDADVIFTNKNWLVDGVKEFKKGANIIQPFEYCVHLNKNELEPCFNTENYKDHFITSFVQITNREMWRSFSANYKDYEPVSRDINYDKHGHVGFAWGAKREVLDRIKLYDKALIGGADHIIAHAAAGHIPHKCIDKSFSDDLDSVYEWSRLFFSEVKGRISYVKGDLYHIWHGDITKRSYLQRIKDFTKYTKPMNSKDSNGLYRYPKTQEGQRAKTYMHSYFNSREEVDNSFSNSMLVGYLTDDALIGTVIGGNPAGAILGDLMNDSNNIHGKSISKSEALEGLGDPKTWENHSSETYKQFESLPLEKPADDVNSHAPECNYSENFS